MSSDVPRQGPTMGPDLPRPVATPPEGDFTLSIDDASLLYERAGHPRTPRSIQRYCAKGHLEFRRMETPFGEKFLITPASVMKHIAYIEELRPIATGRDESRHAAATVVRESTEIVAEPQLATSGDEPRRATTADKYVAALERENDFLRGQIVVKDTQIASLQERAHETNLLINGLQRLLAPLLAAPDRDIRDRSRDEGLS